MTPHYTALLIIIIIVIDAADVMSSIDKLKCNCSCGLDGLPPILFRYLKHCLCHPLAVM